MKTLWGKTTLSESMPTQPRVEQLVYRARKTGAPLSAPEKVGVVKRAEFTHLTGGPGERSRRNRCVLIRFFSGRTFPVVSADRGVLLCMHLFRTRQTRVQCLCTDDDESDRLAVLSEMARRCGPKCSARSGAALSSSTGLRASSERCSSNPVLELDRAESILLMVLVVVCVAAILFPGLILVPHLDDFFDAMQLSQDESPPASSRWHGFEFNATLGYPGEGPPSPFSATASHARLVKMGGPVDKGKGHPLAFVLAWTALGGTVSAPGNDPASGEVWLPRPRLYSQASAKRELDSPKEQPSSQRKRPSNKERAEHILSGDAVNAALLGELRNPDGRCSAHKVCHHPLPSQAPCFSNLWSSKVAFEKHLERFLGYSQEIRSSVVFSLLQDQFYCDSGPDGMPINSDRKWHYVVSTEHGLRSVCQHVFLLVYPIGGTTLLRLKGRIESGCTGAHAKMEEGGTVRYEGKATMRDDIIGWYISYATCIGDYMPDGQEIIVPRRWRSEEFAELEYSLGLDASKYGYFCKVLKHAPELKHICRARKLLNFQHCTTCVDLNEKVKMAMQTRDPEKVKNAKAERRAHHMMTRAERLAYYERRELGRASCDTLSLILDKWDSAKTTVPYFARSPGHWWSSLKHDVLEQHVLGVRVHDQPNRHYFFTINSTISGSANLNVEGIRRVLVDQYSSRPMPRTMYVQGDNASDNKCWTLLLFFAMLVYHGYTNDVYFSFLIVGHTHEDIDQVFSILSRFLKGIGRVADPAQFDADLKAAMGDRPAHFENMWCVFDWIKFLKPSLRTPPPVGIQHANLRTVDGAVVTLVPHTFWIHKRSCDGIVVLHYKELSADPVWLPPLVPNASPLVTDPNGIEFLNPNVAPPDPFLCKPCEMEFEV